jgi:hypothetical protein
MELDLGVDGADLATPDGAPVAWMLRLRAVFPGLLIGGLIPPPWDKLVHLAWFAVLAGLLHFGLGEVVVKGRSPSHWKSNRAFRQRSVHTAEAAGKKPAAFPVYLLLAGGGAVVDRRRGFIFRALTWSAGLCIVCAFFCAYTYWRGD